MTLRPFFAAVLVLAPGLAGAAPCDSIWQRPLPEGEVLLARLSPLADNPGKRHVFEVMRRGVWNIVWAEFDNAEPGAFFIESRGGRLVRAETWGGVAPPEEAKSIEEWAMKQGANFPRALAQCFAWYVTVGREGPTARANPFK